MTAIRSNPTDGDIYAAVNKQRDTSWWAVNNEVWKAIDYLAALYVMWVPRVAPSVVAIPAAGSVSYTATKTCLVVVNWHITANTNGTYKTEINGATVSSGATGGSANCVFSEQWILTEGSTIKFTANSNTASEYKVISINTKQAST